MNPNTATISSMQPPDVRLHMSTNTKRALLVAGLVIGGYWLSQGGGTPDDFAFLAVQTSNSQDQPSDSPTYDSPSQSGLPSNMGDFGCGKKAQSTGNVAATRGQFDNKSQTAIVNKKLASGLSGAFGCGNQLLGSISLGQPAASKQLSAALSAAQAENMDGDKPGTKSADAASLAKVCGSNGPSDNKKANFGNFSAQAWGCISASGSMFVVDPKSGIWINIVRDGPCGSSKKQAASDRTAANAVVKQLS